MGGETEMEGDTTDSGEDIDALSSREEWTRKESLTRLN